MRVQYQVHIFTILSQLDDKRRVQRVQKSSHLLLFVDDGKVEQGGRGSIVLNIRRCRPEAAPRGEH